MRLCELFEEKAESANPFVRDVVDVPEKLERLGKKVRFYLGVHDAHAGEVYGSLYAFDPDDHPGGFNPGFGDYYGRIDWTSHGGVTRINWIEVKDPWKRLGLATAMVDQLKNEMDESIEFTLGTEDGAAFMRSL